MQVRGLKNKMSRLKERKRISWKDAATVLLIVLFLILLVYIFINSYAFTQDPCQYCMDKVGKICIENFTNTFADMYN